MESMPLISVIVPIYKVEKYLPKCIESILEQSYTNLEIILVDDGSPDRCGEICDEYAKNDNRIIVLHKENGGLSDARNAGVGIATGEYISFVDSDDYLTFDCIEYLYNLSQEHNADLVIGGNEKFDDETGNIIFNTLTHSEDIKIMNRYEAMYDALENGCSAWARLYKASVHKDILFPVGEINEDEAIVLEVLDNCTNIVKTSRVVYHYRWREASITSADFHEKKLIWYKHCKDNLDFVKEKYPQLETVAKKRYVGSLIWLLIMMKDEYNKYRETIINMRKELNTHLVFYLKTDASLYSKIQAVMIAKSYSIFRTLLKVLKKKYR